MIKPEIPQHPLNQKPGEVKAREENPASTLGNITFNMIRPDVDVFRPISRTHANHLKPTNG